jgi:hypothetical protein
MIGQRRGGALMLLTRKQIQKRLDAFEASLPQLVKDHEERADFLCAFAGEADEIMENASAADDVWAGEQIDQMLREHGFPPGEEIPCDG